MAISNSGEVKRYTLEMPMELYTELRGVADSQRITIAELLRRFIKLGLITVQMEQTPGGAVVLREGNKERELVFV